LHRANGGYLVLDARSVLSEPYSWTALKRALKAGQVKIENLADLLSLTSTITLEPDPIPVSVKVVLVGERKLQALLALVDPELSEHFSVIADFEQIFDRSGPNEALYARRLARIAREAGLRPLDRGAVARALEHASRDTDDSQKLTLRMDRMKTLLCEADFWAKQAKRDITSAEHIQRAIDERIRRVGRMNERMRESILRDIGLIETAGAKLGQVNALSVYQIGEVAFGRPTRVTARVRPGAGKVVDIERETKLGGPLHSKGVLILSGYLAGRYALDGPMSLLASLVFEQSYAGVDGDSASSAELYALLSALAEIPLRQDLAVTGSVNQHGQVQAIGGVNEKVEGFFDVCAARGLTGSQGVVIPASNVQHLMLRHDVVQACQEGRFAVYPVATIDEGAALMMGRAAGERRGAEGFPADSINARVEAKLRAFAQVARAFAHPEQNRG
jgi:predicted ATP-dependent protease